MKEKNAIFRYVSKHAFRNLLRPLFLKTNNIIKKLFFISFLEELKESVADEEEEDSDDDIEPIAEFRFVPSDKSACECYLELILFPLNTKHSFHPYPHILLYLY